MRRSLARKGGKEKNSTLLLLLKGDMGDRAVKDAGTWGISLGKKPESESIRRRREGGPKASFGPGGLV